jgi:MoxR-like ATPase
MTEAPAPAPATSGSDSELAERIGSFRETFDRLRTAVARTIVGQDEVVAGVLTALAAGGHVLLEGVPGLGKTLLVRSVAQSLELSFKRIQFTPDLMPADVVGTNVLVDGEGGRRTFEFRRGPVFAHVVLADEVNRATPKTQSALLEAMQERSVTVATTSYPLPEPFFVLATQNPLEMEGTYPLPEAQLDRFLFKIRVPFPAAAELADILGRTTSLPGPAPVPVAHGADLLALQDLVRRVPIASHVADYVVRLVMNTHPERPESPPDTRRFVRFGASPRGAQALVLAAKVRALVAGRINVGFADVRAMVLPALRHRLILSFEGQAEGVDPDRLIGTVLEATPEEAAGA